MAESHVVSALVSKRAEIAGFIARTKQQFSQFRADLVHLDATLRLFAPELEPKTISAKRIRQADLWFEHGELPRRVLDALRRVGEEFETLVENVKGQRSRAHREFAWRHSCPPRGLQWTNIRGEPVSEGPSYHGGVARTSCLASVVPVRRDSRSLPQ